ncbi:MAG: ABC transporter ATP-binding protein [Candidatus Sumerlaeia bacterium]|nr:ABC transporter ATP-binding protein [Candidatus Sumerlaeia bacterium]
MSAPSPAPATAEPSSASRTAVELRAVEKSYPGPDGGAPVSVLRGVTLDFAEGSFVALMGASGSGKTTLLNLIGGLDAPDEGTIRLDGTDYAHFDDDGRSEFRLRHIGFIFQFFNLLPNLTVRENIALPVLLLRRSERDARDAAARMAEEVGLGNKLDRMAHQLSGGEMQRVAIARALVHGPRLLLADEPTGNLDSKTGETILGLVRALAASHGATVVMATHDASAAAAADYTIHMRDGRVVAS